MFAVAQFAVSNYVSAQLTDTIAALLSAGAVVALLALCSCSPACYRGWCLSDHFRVRPLPRPNSATISHSVSLATALL